MAPESERAKMQGLVGRFVWLCVGCGIGYYLAVIQ